MKDAMSNQTTKPLAPVANEEPFQYEAILHHQQQAAEKTGVISVALAGNIAAYREPNLFDVLEQDENYKDKVPDLQATDNKHLVNREGKPVALSTFQMKIVCALSVFMSQEKDSDDIRLYIENIAKGKKVNVNPALPISISALTKKVSPDQKARARQKESVINELHKLSEIKQVQTFQKRGSKEDKARVIMSLIHIDAQLEDLSPDKRQDIDVMRISFSPIFFYELATKYAVIKPSLFRIWGTRGSGTETELFSALLFDLMEKYSNHRTAAIHAANSIEKKRYKTDEAYYAAIEKAQRKELIYSEYAHNIRRRCTTDYESTRKMKADFKKHLDSAIDALIKYVGIITEAKRTTTQEGERIDFVFNLDYSKNEQGESIAIAQE